MKAMKWVRWVFFDKFGWPILFLSKEDALASIGNLTWRPRKVYITEAKPRRARRKK